MASEHSSYMIGAEVIAFVIDRKIRKLSNHTIDYYQRELDGFANWADENNLRNVQDITPDLLRRFLLQLGERRNEGGVHAAYRAIKCFLRWWEAEAEPENWRNPITKVRPPKLSTEPIEGIQPDEFEQLLLACNYGRKSIRQRDRAILTALYDTGLRVTELADLNRGDVDLKTGQVVVREGKGKKLRVVFLGANARRELIRYLRTQPKREKDAPLFLSSKGERFARQGINSILRKLADRIGSEVQSPHDFRRGFTLQSLRNGADIVSIARQLGHSNTNLVARYARQTTEDLQIVHDKTSPVDNL